MSEFDFRRRLPDTLHSEDWRPIDRAVARWVLAHGGSPLLARVAAWASHAEGMGDSVLVLAGDGAGARLASLDDEALQALAAEPLVQALPVNTRRSAQAAEAAAPSRAEQAAIESGSGSPIASPIASASASQPFDPAVAAPFADPAEPQALSPFVLQGNQFYLRRNHAHEIAVAADLRARRASAACTAAEPTAPGRAGLDPPHGTTITPTLSPDLHTRIDELFGHNRSPQVEAQRAAVAQFESRRLFVLTGGPGTGKTTTVLRMLLQRIRSHTQAHGSPPRLRLAAPTGKAAQRLAESMAAGGKALQVGADALAVDWQAALSHVLGAEASTLHRLLGSRGPGRGPAYHRGRPLPLDLLVIDEASMIDLGLLRAVLDALPADASLLLVGDADQLASVGTGSVLRDLVEALADQPRGDLVRLVHSFRAQQALQPLNAALKAGDVEAFERAASAAGSAVQRLSLAHPRALAAALRAHATAVFDALQAAAVFAPLPAAADAEAAAVQHAFAALRQHQLLCALRETEFGAQQADSALAQWLKSHLHLPPGQQWFAGRAVIIQHNDYASGLFNGDIGLCLGRADGSLRVWFEAAARPASAGPQDQPTRAAPMLPRAFSPGSLPPHAGAFALSVHKSQGSEYEHVALLLPPQPEHPILSRSLLYTGATRARSSLQLWASDAVLQAALSRPALRSSGLRARLR